MTHSSANDSIVMQ